MNWKRVQCKKYSSDTQIFTTMKNTTNPLYCRVTQCNIIFRESKTIPPNWRRMQQNAGHAAMVIFSAPPCAGGFILEPRFLLSMIMTMVRVNGVNLNQIVGQKIKLNSHFGPSSQNLSCLIKGDFLNRSKVLKYMHASKSDRSGWKFFMHFGRFPVGDLLEWLLDYHNPWKANWNDPRGHSRNDYFPPFNVLFHFLKSLPGNISKRVNYT